MNIISKTQAFFALQAKVNQANALYLKDHKRRFVIPFTDGKLEVLSIDEALTLKKQGSLPQDLTAKTIYGAAFYWTDTKCSHATVKGKMPQRERHRRRQFFYRWFTFHHTSTTKTL